MDSIKFKDLNLTVIKFDLSDNGEGKILTFKAKLTMKEFNTIKELAKAKDEYFDVEYEDSKYKMRVGRPYWDLSGDKIVCHITLVEDVYDKNDKEFMGNTFNVSFREENLVIKNMSLLKELITLLVDKKIMSENEVKTLYDIAKKNEFDRRIESFQVIDLDKYDL